MAKNGPTGREKLSDAGRSLEKPISDLGKSAKKLDAAGTGLSHNMEDTFDNFNALKTSVRAKTSANAGMFGSASLVGKAAKNIFEFPVFVSTSVPVDFATATNSLLEQMYASYLQMAVSMNPVVSARDVEKGLVFQNLKTDTTKYMEYTTMFYAHEACQNTIICDDGSILEFHMVTLSPQDYALIQEACDYQPLSEFEHFFQEAHGGKDPKRQRRNNQPDPYDYYDDDDDDDDDSGDHNKTDYHDLKTQELEIRLQELADKKSDRKAREERQKIEDELKSRYADESHEMNKRRTAQQMKHDTEDNQRKREEHDAKMTDREEDRARKRRDEIRDQRADKRAEDQNRRAEADEARKNAREKRDEEMHNIDKLTKLHRDKADMKIKAPQFMDETKIQKLNTMKPLMMTVGLRVMTGNVLSDMVDYVVGVKTHCRLVKADILPDVAEYPMKEMNRLSKRAKWRAGEIKFLDYLFSRSEKKQAAYDSKDPNRKWYHRLYTLAHSKGSSFAAYKITGKRSPDGLIPNATIIMSKSDVDMIEMEKGIDLLKGSTAKRFCQELFLMSLIVIDTDAQSIKILLPDINNDFEVHSLASVNKQLATLDTAGTVSREVSKMMRGQ